jgi:hypothetical protein
VKLATHVVAPINRNEDFEMRHLTNVFNEIWALAEERNRQGAGFIRIYESKKRYVTFGIYDSVTKKYCLFNTINLVGNFRYNSKVVPPEFAEMRNLVTG